MTMVAENAVTYMANLCIFHMYHMVIKSISAQTAVIIYKIYVRVAQI